MWLARSARWLWVFCGLDWVRLERIGDMSTRCEILLWRFPAVFFLGRITVYLLFWWCNLSFLCFVFCKALSVIEYLVSNGSERAVDEIIEHTYQISVSLFFYFLLYICISRFSVVDLVVFYWHDLCLWLVSHEFWVCWTEWKRCGNQCEKEGGKHSCSLE